MIVGSSSFSLLFYSFLQSCYHFLPYRFAIPTVMLFDLSLLGLFGPSSYSSLNDSIWSIRFFITLLVGSFVPFSPWASLAHLLSLGLFLTLHSHELLLTPLGFPGLITLSFILGAYGLAISPLLSLLALLQACCGPFSLFYITYCLWVCYFSLSGLF